MQAAFGLKLGRRFGLDGVELLGPTYRLAPLVDPFGHGFCLLQFLGNGYDEIAG